MFYFFIILGMRKNNISRFDPWIITHNLRFSRYFLRIYIEIRWFCFSLLLIWWKFMLVRTISLEQIRGLELGAEKNWKSVYAQILPKKKPKFPDILAFVPLFHTRYCTVKLRSKSSFSTWGINKIVTFWTILLENFVPKMGKISLYF